MKYDVDHCADSGICIVTVSGEHKRPEDSKILQQVALDYCTKQQCSRFLFDMRKAKVTGTTMDVYETGMEPIVQKFDRSRFKIALAYSGDMTDHKFMETVLVNRGYNVRVFDDYDNALSWLTDDGENAHQA